MTLAFWSRQKGSTRPCKPFLRTLGRISGGRSLSRTSQKTTWSSSRHLAVFRRAAKSPQTGWKCLSVTLRRRATPNCDTSIVFAKGQSQAKARAAWAVERLSLARRRASARKASAYLRQPSGRTEEEETGGILISTNFVEKIPPQTVQNHWATSELVLAHWRP